MHASDTERDREREMVELNLMVWRAALKEEQQNSCGLSSSERRRELVCVTSGNSYLGSHIVKELLAHGYPVRVTVQYQGTTSSRNVPRYSNIYYGDVTTAKLAELIKQPIESKLILYN